MKNPLSYKSYLKKTISLKLLLSISSISVLIFCFYSFSKDLYLWSAILPDFYIIFFVSTAFLLLFLYVFLNLRNKYLILVKAEREINLSKQFLRTVIDANPNLIFVKNRNGRFTLVNQAVADLYGTTVENLLGKCDADFNNDLSEVQHFLDHDRLVMDYGQEVFITEEKITDADGIVHWLQTTKRPIKFNKDEDPQVLGVATDISENKKLYEQLVQAQKMEAIGQLAGGIAHDFNNYLTGIAGYTGLLKISTSKPEDIQHATAMIESITHKASQLTDKLLGFARKGKHQNTKIDIHSCIKDTLSLLNRTIEKNIIIEKNLLAFPPNIVGDPSQMQQLVLNLILNARDAISVHHDNLSQGKISISTSIIEISSDSNDTSLDLKDGTYMSLSVTDNGCGIAYEHLNKIFEPFFSTKEPGKGTGMGLAMVYGIVKNHQGTIKVESKPSKGSKFTLFLPSAGLNAGYSMETIHTANLAAVRGAGQILIVDDHQVILDVTSRMLRYLGYDVVTAKDGVEALNYYEENYEDVDLVILDMVMPNMGAKDCFKELKKINSNVKVILSTGYGRNYAAQEIINEGISAFVQKPYHIEKLSQIVSKVLSFGDPARESVLKNDDKNLYS